jgi:hypothetical protein
MKDSKLITDDLPKLDCSTCDHFKRRHKVIDTYHGRYGLECSNVTWPIEHCILRDFESHSQKLELKLKIQ